MTSSHIDHIDHYFPPMREVSFKIILYLKDFSARLLNKLTHYVPILKFQILT